MAEVLAESSADMCQAGAAAFSPIWISFLYKMALQDVSRNIVLDSDVSEAMFIYLELD